MLCITPKDMQVKWLMALKLIFTGMQERIVRSAMKSQLHMRSTPHLDPPILQHPAEGSFLCLDEKHTLAPETMKTDAQASYFNSKKISKYLIR